MLCTTLSEAFRPFYLNKGSFMSVVLKSAARLPFAPIVAAFFAVAVATLMIAMPTWMLEYYAARTGLAAALPAAQAPLGQTARMAAVGIGALGAGFLTWLAMIPVGKWLDQSAKPVFEVAPLVSAEDIAAENDEWFKRPPIFADRDLGAPFMAEEAALVEPALESEPEPEPEAAPESLDEVSVDADADELVLDDNEVLTEEQADAIASWPLIADDVASDVAASDPVNSDAVTFDHVPVVDAVTPVEPIDFVSVPNDAPTPLPDDMPMPIAKGSINDMMSRLEHGVARRSSIRALVQSHEEANNESTEPAEKAAARR
jgi:hypothetical protein